MYPESGSPLLPTGLVNLVELPGVELDQSTAINYDPSMVIQQTMTNSGAITVMTDIPGDPLTLLGGTHEREEAEPSAVTYYDASVAGDQLIQIPTNDLSGNTHTITLPISLLGDAGSGVSILQGFGQIPLSLGGGDPTSDTVTLRAPVEADTMISSSGDQNYVLPELQGSIIAVSNNSAAIESTNKLLEFSQDLTSQSNSNSINLSKVVTPGTLNANSKLPINKPVLQYATSAGIKQNNLQSITNNKKIFGTGTNAVSAQGVLQKVGNRLVTVLPRPEDIKKLYENKSLLLSVKGNTSSPLNRPLLNQGRKVPVPVRPHQKYSRRRGRGKSSLIHNKFLNKTAVDTSTVSILDKNFINSENNNCDTSLTDEQQEKLKMKTGDGNKIVVDMLLPDGGPTSMVLMPNSNYDDTLDKIIPPPPIRRGRKRKRGRGRPRGTFVISSSGRKPGRPRKVEMLVEGPHGARMIHTGPDTRKIKQETHDDDENLISSDVHLEQILSHLDGKDDTSSNDFVTQQLEDNEQDEVKDIKLEDENDTRDPKRRRLPPRKRGTR